ncbi:MAG: HD domain-containing phosphohydrolase [Vicinamibacterales bacterium]
MSAVEPLVLVVDDEDANRELLTRLLVRRHYQVCSEPNAAAAQAFLLAADRLPDLILLDIMMPGIDGLSLCRQLKQQPLTRLIPIVLMTGMDTAGQKIEGIEAGADDFLTKPFQLEELAARVASLVRLKRYTDDLESAQSVIISLALTVEARDPYTDGHCQRLAAYAAALGTQAGLPASDIEALERGGYLHDVGKIGVPDAILLKPGPLTRDEYTRMKLHTTIGERLCGDLRSLRSVRGIVRHHHERMDGSGYPDGLKGDAISLTAQIVGLVDAYDAMTTTRPYREARSESAALEELTKDAERGQLNADLVRLFIGMGGR